MKKTFLSAKGPKAGGPYSSAVCDEKTVYVSGITGTDPATGKLVPGGIEPETHQVLANITTVLGEMGLTPAHVLKTTVFLADIGDFALINGIYAGTFGPDFPARSCFQVAALPGGARIEIECIAAKEI